MSRDDGFSVMDVSTDYHNDPKWRRLYRASPELLPVAFMAYTATVAESWKAGRRVTLEDAWPALLTYDPAVVSALTTAGFLDRRGLIVSRAWASWFDVAARRRQDRRFEGMVGGLMKSLGLNRDLAIEEALRRSGSRPRHPSGDPKPDLTRTVLSVPSDPVRPPNAREIDALKERGRTKTPERIGDYMTRSRG